MPPKKETKAGGRVKNLAPRSLTGKQAKQVKGGGTPKRWVSRNFKIEV
jgi:hypothetical protein